MDFRPPIERLREALSDVERDDPRMEAMALLAQGKQLKPVWNVADDRPATMTELEEAVRILEAAEAAALPLERQIGSLCLYCMDHFWPGPGEDYCARCLHDRQPQEREAGATMSPALLRLLQAAANVKKTHVYEAAKWGRPGEEGRKNWNTFSRWWELVKSKQDAIRAYLAHASEVERQNAETLTAAEAIRKKYETR